MTVCLAAIAAEGNAIVMVADRSISMDRAGRTVLKTDSAVTKIKLLHQQWVGLISGRIDFGRTVLSWAEDRHKFEPQKHLVERAKLAYQEARKVEIRDSILVPSLLDYTWYENRVSAEISDKDVLFEKVFNAIHNHNMATSLLLCGFEDSMRVYIYYN
jgi:hypothetical protein